MKNKIGLRKIFRQKQQKVRKSLGKLVNIDCYYLLNTAEFKVSCTRHVKEDWKLDDSIPYASRSSSFPSFFLQNVNFNREKIQKVLPVAFTLMSGDVGLGRQDNFL
jgi:hypothetical protein